jgi:hypothetical protein
MNAEGLAVDPRSADGYVFGKQLDGTCSVYRLPAPWTTVGIATLKRVGKLNFPREASPIATMVTAADISPDGKRLVTRSYVGGWEWRVPGSDQAGAFARIFEREPTALTLATEPQGEALCFSADGRALLTISEKVPTTLYEVRASKSGESAGP